MSTRTYVFRTFTSIPLMRTPPDPIHGTVTSTLRMFQALMMMTTTEQVSDEQLEYVQTVLKAKFPKELKMFFEGDDGAVGNLKLEDKWQLITPLLQALWGGTLLRLACTIDLTVGSLWYFPWPGSTKIHTTQPFSEMVQSFTCAAHLAYREMPPNSKQGCKERAAQFQFHAWKWQSLWTAFPKRIRRKQFSPWCHAFACHFSFFLLEYGSLRWFSARTAEMLHNPTRADFNTKSMCSVSGAISYTMACACVDNALRISC